MKQKNCYYLNAEKGWDYSDNQTSVNDSNSPVALLAGVSKTQETGLMLSLKLN